MKAKYMMDVQDVMNELGISKSKAYQVIPAMVIQQ